MMDKLNSDLHKDEHSVNHIAHSRMVVFYSKYKPFLKNLSKINPWTSENKYVEYLQDSYIPKRDYIIYHIGTYSIDIIEKYKENIIAFQYGLVGCRLMIVDPDTKQHIQIAIGCPPRTINGHILLSNLNIISYDANELFKFIDENAHLQIPFSVLDNKKVGIH